MITLGQGKRGVAAANQDIPETPEKPLIFDLGVRYANPNPRRAAQEADDPGAHHVEEERMKKTEILGKFSATLLSAGVLVPDQADADVIPLQDPSFENFVVPAVGYAYANTYRPTSGWFDDLDSPLPADDPAPITPLTLN